MRGAFGGYLGPKMKSKAITWARETPNLKNLPGRIKKKKKVLKKLVRRHY